MTLDIPSELLDGILIASLRNSYPDIQAGQHPPMFSIDEEEDRKAVKKLRKAFRLVADYYGEKL